MVIVWVEDESALLTECADYLCRESINVLGASTFEEAEALIERSRPDLLLVDWMLGDKVSGIDICKYNEKTWQLPIIMVTARGDEFDKVLALELGADDYLTKPFGLRELSARIKAVMRRVTKHEPVTPEQRQADCITRGTLRLDKIKFTVEKSGVRIDLTRTEFLLLWKLASHPGRVFSRTHLMDEALGEGFWVMSGQWIHIFVT